MEVIDIEEIKELNRRKGLYWFSPRTTRYFHSCYPKNAYHADEDHNAYFVSSERMDDSCPRLYSIRVCDMDTGSIDTVGEFQAYASRLQALHELKRKLAVQDLQAWTKNEMRRMKGAKEV